MISKELIIYSLRNIWERKTRNFLTVLSIFIGITAIFIFISFGLGLYGYIEKMTSTGTADKVLIQPKGASIAGLDETFILTDSDVRAIKKVHGVKEVAGVYIKPVEIKQDKKIKYEFLMGYDPEKPLVLDLFGNIGILEGRELKKGDTNKVTLGYGYTVKNSIFPKKYELNDLINIQGQDFKIVGFYEEVGNPQDDANVYVVDDSIDTLYPNSSNPYGWVIARVDTEEMDRIVEDIEKKLRDVRDEDKGKETFFVQSYADMLESYMGALDIVIGFIILIALISVLVSAVNTSNTMVSSVLERTKEIGVIKSIGGQNSDIFKIFLFESGFLGFIGGLIGIILGVISTYIGGNILEGLGLGFLQPSYSTELFVGCVLFAILTGAISGVIPALRASKLSPTEALREE